MRDNVFAVDIGGSKLICGVLTKDGEIIDTYRVDYPKEYNLETIIGFIRLGYERLKKYPCSCCGIAIPGLSDPESGDWLYSPFSGIENVPITKIVNQITGLPAYGDNDVNVSALAEWYFGLCRNTDDFLWITVSNGIGGGLFLNGKLYRGKSLNAGEIGHFIVEENNPRKCGCGNLGCLEAMASGASIANIYNEITGNKLVGPQIAELAREGDKIAYEVWANAGAYIGKAISYAVNLLGIDCVVLGGGAAEAFDLLKPSIDASIKKYTFSSANPNVKILHSSLGKYAALTGCVALTKYNSDNKEGAFENE